MRATVWTLAIDRWAVSVSYTHLDVYKRQIECKPFKKTHHEQLKLVTSFGWIDFDRLRGLEQDIRDLLDQAGELSLIHI